MKKRRSNLFFQKIIPVIGSLVMLYTLFSLSKVVWRNYQIEKETSQLKEEINVLEETNQHFLNLIAYFKTDAYHEKEVRQRLGYKKSGEEVLLVPDIERNVVTEEQVEEQEDKKTYQIWWDFFFKVRE